MISDGQKSVLRR
jgi:hypothetical protein